MTRSPSSHDLTHPHAARRRSGAELDASSTPRRVVDDLGQDDVDYIRRAIALATRSRDRRPRPAVPRLRSRRRGAWARPPSASRRSSTTWRSATTSCTASTTGPTTRRSPAKGYEWDNVCPGDQWRHTHNELHHVHTNILGKDRDIGYGAIRVSRRAAVDAGRARRTRSSRSGSAPNFDLGVMLHDAEIERLLSGDKPGARPGRPSVTGSASAAGSPSRTTSSGRR